MSRSKIIGVVALILALAVTISAAAYDRSKPDFVLPDSSGLDIYSCRYTGIEPENPKILNLLSDLSGFELKMENKYLAVYYREANKGLRILNKSNGYVWGGLSEDEPENMNTTWSLMANSILTIDYFDEQLQSSRMSLGDENVAAEYEWYKDRCVCSADFKDAGISFEFSIILKGEAITFEMKRDSIQEKDIYKLQSVWVLPFLGSVEQDSIDGYMFIPDGSGALVRYSKSAQYVSAYDERIYGKDAAVDEMSTAGDLLAKRNNDYLTDMPQITAPVYGAVHGAYKNGYMAVVESGAEYASVYLSPAGLITDYNWVSARFDWRRSYPRPVNNSGVSIMSTEDEVADVDIRLSFYFLEEKDACYTGMAVKYREMLIEDGVLGSKERSDERIPLHIDIMAADIRDTIWGNRYVRLTGIDELAEITSKLQNNGISNLNIAYFGWQKGGLSGAKFGQTKLDRRLGSAGQLAGLAEAINETGRFYLAANMVSFNADQAGAANEAALKNTNAYASKTRNNSRLIYPTEYFAKPLSIAEKLENLIKRNEDYDFYLTRIGNSLYSDFSRKGSCTRREAMDNALSIIEKLESKPMLEQPNMYLWKYTGEYFNMPVSNSQYLFESDSVPFLSIVLKGSIDYYAPYANQGFYTDNSILKMIEYAAYPSFLIMAAENEELIDTPLADYFSLCFSDWEGLIYKIYNKINPALSKVEGSMITNHIMIDEGIPKVSYENGTDIYINYTAYDYTLDDGTVIPPHDYLVKEK